MSSGVRLFAFPSIDRASLVAGLAEVALRSLDDYTSGLTAGASFAGILFSRCREIQDETN
jgi:hypothetical protein